MLLPRVCCLPPRAPPLLRVPSSAYHHRSCVRVCVRVASIGVYISSRQVCASVYHQRDPFWVTSQNHMPCVSWPVPSAPLHTLQYQSHTSTALPLPSVPTSLHYYEKTVHLSQLAAHRQQPLNLKSLRTHCTALRCTAQPILLRGSDVTRLSYKSTTTTTVRKKKNHKKSGLGALHCIALGCAALRHNVCRCCPLLTADTIHPSIHPFIQPRPRTASCLLLWP